MKGLRSLGKFGLICSLLAGSLYLSPYVSIFLISRAAKDKDYSSAVKYLDIPSIRDSFKQQMVEYIKYSSKADGLSGGAWGPLYMGIGGAMSELVIQNAVSDEGIKKLLETGQSPLTAEGNSGLVDYRTLLNGAKYSYLSFDQFKVDLSGAPAWFPNELILQRHNLFTWKISSIRLDLSASVESSDSANNKLSCGKAIDNVETEISGVSRIPIYESHKRDIESPFAGRSKSYSFILGGTGSFMSYDSPGGKMISGLLSDSAKLERLSQIIVDSCDDIASVGFAKYATGSSVDWYYQPEGVVEGKCVDFGNPLPGWGWNYC